MARGGKGPTRQQRRKEGGWGGSMKGIPYAKVHDMEGVAADKDAAMNNAFKGGNEDMWYRFFCACDPMDKERMRKFGGFMILLAVWGVAAFMFLRAGEVHTDKLVDSSNSIRYIPLFISAGIVAIMLLIKWFNAIMSTWRDPVSKILNTIATLSVITGAILYYWYITDENDPTNKNAKLATYYMLGIAFVIGGFNAATSADVFDASWT